jgi:hypothetical protein
VLGGCRDRLWALAGLLADHSPVWEDFRYPVALALAPAYPESARCHKSRPSMNFGVFYNLKQVAND